MKCPKCGSKESYVNISIGIEEYVRRRRECSECGHRFTTYEIVMTPKEYKKRCEVNNGNC